MDENKTSEHKTNKPRKLKDWGKLIWDLLWDLKNIKSHMDGGRIPSCV